MTAAKGAPRPPAVVVQSYHPNPPEWIARCLASAREWASTAGFAYRFVDDALFDRLPNRMREKTASRISTASDLARLYLIEDLHAEGWETAIWLDADVLVFDPKGLAAAVDVDDEYLLGREAWVSADGKGRAKARKGVHNALLAARAGNAFLPFYREAVERILDRHEGPMVPQLVGPKLLTALDNMIGLPATWAVNMASPRVVAELAAAENGPALTALLTWSGSAPAAFNLCHSYLGRNDDGVEVTEALLNRAIESCLSRKTALFPASKPVAPRVRHEDDAPSP